VSFPGGDLASASWILNGYTAPRRSAGPAGRLADRYGRRLVFVIGTAVFTLGSATCAPATSIPLLVGFRAIQAVGAALVMPTSLALLLAAFPVAKPGGRREHVGRGRWGRRRRRASAGGLLVPLSSRWVFLVNLPVGVLALAFAPKVLRESKDTGSGVPDLLGAAGLILGVGALAWALVTGLGEGWGSTEVLIALGLTVAGLLWVVLRSARLDRDVARLGHRGRTVAYAGPAHGRPGIPDHRRPARPPARTGTGHPHRLGVVRAGRGDLDLADRPGSAVRHGPAPRPVPHRGRGRARPAEPVRCGRSGAARTAVGRGFLNDQYRPAGRHRARYRDPGRPVRTGTGSGRIPARDLPGHRRARGGLAALGITLRRHTDTHAEHVPPPAGEPASRGLHGRVRRPDGDSVPGAAVTLIDAGGREVHAGLTDDNGTFSCDTPPDGPAVVVASRSGHRPEALRLAAGHNSDLDTNKKLN
jgi:MFS transporter/carboxypeptidase family protein